MKRIVAVVLSLTFFSVPPVSILAEASVVKEASSSVSAGALPIEACMPSTQFDDKERQDECFQALFFGAAACVILGKVTIGAVCVGAAYFAAAACTCLSAWGFIEYPIAEILYAECSATAWQTRRGVAYYCGEPPEWSMPPDDTEDCQEGQDDSPN